MAWTINVVFHIQVVHFNEFQVVMMGTLYEIGIMLFEVPTGVVADLVSRRLSACLGWFFVGLSFLLEGFFPTPLPVIASQLLLGFGDTFVSGAHDAWVVDEMTAEKDARDPGQALMAGSRASIYGRLIGTWVALLFAQASLQTVLIAAGLGFVVFAPTAFSLMRENGFKKSSDQRSFWKNFRDGWGAVSKSRLLILVLTISVIYGLASEGFDRLWNKSLLNAFSFPKLYLFGNEIKEVWWTIIGTLALLGGLLLNNYVRKRVDTTSPVSIAKTMLVLTVVLIGSIIAFTASKIFAIAVITFVVSRSIRRTLEPLLQTWVNLHASPENRATILSFNGQAHSAGEIVGGPIVGQIGKTLSAATAIFAAALMLLPTLPLLAYFTKKRD